MNFTIRPAQSVIESVHYPEWIIREWKIVFLFSEKLLGQIRKLSKVNNWYEDPVIVEAYLDRVNVCFISIQKYHATFNILPQVGDRLYDEDTGMIVQDRAIDGELMTITFTLSL